LSIIPTSVDAGRSAGEIADGRTGRRVLQESPLREPAQKLEAGRVEITRRLDEHLEIAVVAIVLEIHGLHLP
jgi:hypothetical protein